MTDIKFIQVNAITPFLVGTLLKYWVPNKIFSRKLLDSIMLLTYLDSWLHHQSLQQRNILFPKKTVSYFEFRNSGKACPSSGLGWLSSDEPRLSLFSK